MNNRAPRRQAAPPHWARLDADKEANGQNIFGESSISGEPKWAQALAGIGIVATIITIAGGLVGPALNYLKFGM